MAQGLLHPADVHATKQKMRRKAVSQRVRRHPAIDASPFRRLGLGTPQSLLMRMVALQGGGSVGAGWDEISAPKPMNTDAHPQRKSNKALVATARRRLSCQRSLAPAVATA